MLSALARCGASWKDVNPCPAYSATLNGTLESGLDYSDGGCRYNPHTVPLTFLSVLVDAILAIDQVVFRDRKATLAEFLSAVRNDWQGREDLRLAAVAAPHYGDGSEASIALAARILAALCAYVKTFRNAQGGRFTPAMYNYVEVVSWAGRTAATPDGRRRGDPLSPGLTPSRLHSGDSLGNVIRTVSRMPLRDFPGNTVLTLSFDKTGFDAPRFAAVVRTWIRARAGGHLQINCVSREELADAAAHPEKHQELLVRLYGFSARFVCLEPDKQQEFLSRSIYQ